MSEKIKIYIIWALKNVITLICFTILAILFNKWWIVLFSVLFYSTLKLNEENDKEVK